MGIIKQVLEEAIAVGSSAVLKELRPKADELSRRQAMKEFGESRIKKLLELKLITQRKVGTRYYLSRMEINRALCESSVGHLYWLMRYGKQQTPNKRRMGGILGDCR
ncbi:hypothetical protein [Alistipes dispar]|uniref:hypothetical protein n=1 Tax=Alistipes dispar TaxID=2585119 RepID=UPI003A8C892F